MNIVEEFTHADRKIAIYYDPEPFNPRKEWDNSTIIVHWHRRYDLGDEHIQPMTMEEITAEYRDKGDPILAILPLYLYDHSGLSISTEGFSCRFDSGQVGWVFITESKRKVMGFPDDYTEEQYEEIIRQDVKTYDDYLTGQVYGYEVVGKEGDHLGSCWGYVGDLEGCKVDAKAAAEVSVDPATVGDDLEEHW